MLIRHELAAKSIKNHIKKNNPKMSKKKITDNSQNPLKSFRVWAEKHNPSGVQMLAKKYLYEREELAKYLNPNRCPLLKGYVREWSTDITIAISGVESIGSVEDLVPVLLPSENSSTKKKLKTMEDKLINLSQENATLKKQLKKSESLIKEYQEEKQHISDTNKYNASLPRTRSDWQ